MNPLHTFKLGDFEVTIISEGNVFGDPNIVFEGMDENRWRPLTTLDYQGRMVFGLNIILIRSADRLILLDTGIGERFSARERQIYGIDANATLRSSLAAAGLDPADITIVALTHLHFDHFCGCLMDGDDGPEPLFANAVHLVQRGEWEDALNGHSTMKSSYRPDELQGLAERIEVRRIEGEYRIAPGLTTFVTGGHTEWHQGFRLDAGGRTLVYPGELVPTRSHIRPYWNMAYDMFPHQTLTAKQAFLAEAAAAGWIVAWDHDTVTPWSQIARGNSGFVAVDVEAK